MTLKEKKVSEIHFEQRLKLFIEKENQTLRRLEKLEKIVDILLIPFALITLILSIIL